MSQSSTPLLCYELQCSTSTTSVARTKQCWAPSPTAFLILGRKTSYRQQLQADYFPFVCIYCGFNEQSVTAEAPIYRTPFTK